MVFAAATARILACPENKGMTQAHSTYRSHKRAQALVEMAVMVPFLVIGMMGMLDLGRAFYYQISLTNAVREAARYAALPYYTGLTPVCNTTPPPGAFCPVPADGAIKARFLQELQNTGINATANDVTVLPGEAQRVTDCGTTGSCQYAVTVSATYKFNFITPIIGDLIGNPLTLKTSAEFRTEY